MNIVILQGNLTRDPEVKVIETGGRKTKVANFTIATSRFFTRANGDKDKETTFIPCEAWDTGAESIEKLLHKGDPILINGAIKVEKWETADGDHRSRTKIRVGNFTKLNRAARYNENEAVGPGPDEDTIKTPVAATADSSVPDPGEDIPF